MGSLKGQQYAIDQIQVRLDNPSAGAFLMSKDGEALSDSKDMLIIGLSPTKMTGQVYSSSRTSLKHAGKGPVLAQVLEGEMILNRFNDVSEVVVREVLPNGNLGKTLTLEAHEEGIRLDLSQARSQVLQLTVL